MEHNKNLKLILTIGLALICLALFAQIMGLVPTRPYIPVARKATCTQNLQQISKAFRMYAYEWDDCWPTNRWKSHWGKYLSKDCRLTVTDSQGTKTKCTNNYVEALNPYLEKLDDTRSVRSIWRCPTVMRNNRWQEELNVVTYCMNWYLAERQETSITDASYTLLMRELGMPAQALLRPYPSNPPDKAHPRGSGMPLHPFPSKGELGRGDIGPIIHNEGSLILYADGHTRYREDYLLRAKPVRDDDLDDNTPPSPNASRWRVGEIWITP